MNASAYNHSLIGDVVVSFTIKCYAKGNYLGFLFLFSNVESMQWEQAGRGCLVEERKRKLF